MRVIYAGLDEAGYGPMLGPLCVGLSVFEVEADEDRAPDLWSRLSEAVCREPRDGRRRLPVNDSKALKLSNQGKRHPLTHLERTVLAFAAREGGVAHDDAALLEALGAVLPSAPWYGGPGVDMPLASTADAIGIDANRVHTAMRTGEVQLLDLRCRMTDESAFNEIVRTSGSKAQATASAFIAGIRRVLEAPEARAATEAGGFVRIACDRLGGRTRYEAILERAGAEHVDVVERSERACVYDIEVGGVPARVLFQPEADATHFPVALSSMVAKLVRELMMMRFNRYWSSRAPELKPTAGYTTDARRWLADAAGVVTEAERTAMVRIA